VFNTLLQILEEGRLTDSQGRTVDFRNTVLIMTSNLGTQDLRKANVGFTTGDSAMSYERMKEKVMDALKVHFRPEFLNRIDEVIVFHELDRGEVLQMVDTDDQAPDRQLEGQGLGIELTQSAKELLAEKGYDPQLGAAAAPGHPAHVEDPLSREDPVQGVPRRRDPIVDRNRGTFPIVPVRRRIAFRSVEGFLPSADTGGARGGGEGGGGAPEGGGGKLVLGAGDSGPCRTATELTDPGRLSLDQQNASSAASALKTRGVLDGG
jgi:ATP-dependent Clp protease ATP-binding subunit ClpC